MQAAKGPDQQQDRDRDPDQPQQHVTSHDGCLQKARAQNALRTPWFRRAQSKVACRTDVRVLANDGGDLADSHAALQFTLRSAMAVNFLSVALSSSRFCCS